MITQTYYIGTGEKSAMFTLRCTRRNDDPNLDRFMPDFYLCNLASIDHEELAIEKAKTYTEAMKERIGETEEFKIEFGGVWDEPVNHRRGKLSVWETSALEMIEAGMFPFGKHRGTKIVDAPESYILYFSDMLGKGDNLVSETLCAACQGVALEKGYIAKRDAEREARHQQDLNSNHVGKVGDRMEFEGEVASSFFKENFDYGDINGYWINKVRCGNNLIVAMGSVKIGDKGQHVRFKATVKSHDEYKDVKTTRVNRPKVMEA